MLPRRDPAATAVIEASANIARNVRLKNPEAERQARIDLYRARAKVFQLKAAEQLTLAQLLEDEAKTG